MSANQDREGYQSDRFEDAETRRNVEFVDAAVQRLAGRRDAQLETDATHEARALLRLIRPAERPRALTAVETAEPVIEVTVSIDLSDAQTRELAVRVQTALAAMGLTVPRQAVSVQRR